MKEAAQVPGVSALVLRAGVEAKDVSALTSWFVQLMMQGAQSDGFLSAEIIPPISKSDPQWALVEWFRNAEQAQMYQNSDARNLLKQELVTSFPEDKLKLSEEVSNQVGSRGSVATAIVSRIKPGMEKSYREWEGKIKIAQAQFPGYRGAYYQPPMDSTADQFTTLLRFDTPESLDNWFESDERRQLLLEGKEFIKSTDYQKLSSSFPGWFPVSEKSGQAPARWKTSMLVLLCLYPLAVLQFKYVRPLLSGLSSELITFIGNFTSVIILSWLLLPFVIKRFNGWLYPINQGNGLKSPDLQGAMIVVGLYLLEIVLLMVLVN